jgi:GntR family transcriptional regulator, transcriptional repressor for pyruvate dehydrogenase complex
MAALTGRMTGEGEAIGQPQTLADPIYHHLFSRISSGEYPQHFKLPSEHDLARQFDVSRPVVRDALDRLRQDGLIYSRQGAGSFVKLRSDQAAVLGYSPVGTIADIQRCYEFRLTIETDGAYLAAQRANAPALLHIQQALEALSDATQMRRHREELDFAFHCAVAQAANNHYYSASMKALQDHIAVAMKLHGLSLMGPDSSLDRVYGEHLAIFEAIRDRRAEDARLAMRTHLEGSRDRLFEGKLLDLSL